MTDSTSDPTFTPGAVDEKQHGWAPDAEGTGEAADRVKEANQKAFEGRDTQPESRGDGGENPDVPPRGVGESTGRRGEDMIDRDGSDSGREDHGTKGPSGRPVGEAHRPGPLGQNE
jgi:hypothetical protein